MCGIVGIIQYKNSLERELRNKALHILFSETMFKTEVRGKDATGLYQVHENGEWLMTKKGVKVTEWLRTRAGEGDNEDPIDYRTIVSDWDEHPSELTAVVGHCRAATIGSKGKDNNDNHPFAIQLDEDHALLGIHNGTLKNHEIMYNHLPKFVERQGKVDSEIIFQFMYYLSEKGTLPIDGDMLKYLGARMEGAAAIIMMNTRFPDQVITFRKDRPMEYWMISPLNIVLIASEKPFVESAFSKYNFARDFLPGYEDLPELEFCHRTLAERDYRIFDRSLAWPKGRPIHMDFDKISKTGSMSRINDKIEDGWGIEVKSSTTTNSNTGKNTSNTSSGGTTTEGVKTTKKQESSGSTNKINATVKSDSPNSNDDAVVSVDAIVDVAIIPDNKEAEVGMAHMAALGILVRYDDEKELATSLGLDEREMNDMDGVLMANKLSELHFSLGHAAARLTAQKEVGELREKSAENIRKLERVIKKQIKAENHIWEQRCLTTIIRALVRGRYQLSSKNIGIALANFPNIGKEKSASILAAGVKMLEEAETERVITDLLANFRTAEEALKNTAQ